MIILYINRENTILRHAKQKYNIKIANVQAVYLLKGVLKLKWRL